MTGPRPRHSRCPEGQAFVPGRHGKLVPAHTPNLGADCRCLPCRGKRQAARWTPELRAARSAAYTGRSFRPRAPKRAKADVWTPQQDDALRALLGKGDRFWIAEQLTARFQCPRTATAVHVRIKKLGLSLLTVRPLSRFEVGRSLGVSDALAERWVHDGLLVGIPWHFGGGQRRGHVSQAFAREHVEAFLRAHVDQVAVGRIRDRGFRALAEALTRGARMPLRLAEAAKLAGVCQKTVRYWIDRGRVPGAYQVRGRFWRIPASEVPILRELAALRKAAA